MNTADDLVWNEAFQEEMIAYQNLSTPPNERRKRERSGSDSDDLESDLLLFNVEPLKLRIVCRPITAISCKEMYRAGPLSPLDGYTPACLICKRLGLKCTILEDCSSCEKCASSNQFCGFIRKNTLNKYDLTYTNTSDIRTFLPN